MTWWSGWVTTANLCVLCALCGEEGQKTEDRLLTVGNGESTIIETNDINEITID